MQHIKCSQLKNIYINQLTVKLLWVALKTLV